MVVPHLKPQELLSFLPCTYGWAYSIAIQTRFQNDLNDYEISYLNDYHFVREIYAERHVLPTWIFGNGNGADMYTKALGRQLFDQFCPAETGYMETTLPRPIISLTPTEALKFGAKI